MRPKPTCLRRLSLMLYILFALAPALVAVPARKGLLDFRQPDGTVFQAYLSGDEFGHLVLTPDGCSLIQDAEGWWCYARYDYDGRRVSTGVHAGGRDVPGGVLAAARDIPYDLLRRRRDVQARRTIPLRERELARTRSGEGGGLHRTLIILAQFKDLSFTYTREDFERIINGSGSAGALAYFNEQWKGHTTFQFDITDIVTLPETYAHYGADNEEEEEEHAPEMIRDACAAVGPEIDFSQYDNDGDGVVDNLFVFYAGPNQAEGADENYVWPHQWYLQSGAHINFSRDGVLVDDYACTSELRLVDSQATALANIGTFCHEYTHTFGIPDLYDENDNDGGYAEGLWRSIDLMDAGNYNDDGRTPPNYSAVERWKFGITEGILLTEGTYTLRPVQENGDYYYMPTENEGECFLFECRQAQGWDRYIGGSGLLIYHIDQSNRSAGYSDDIGSNVTAIRRWSLNLVNARPDHQCVDLIEPDPQARTDYQANVKKRDWYSISLLASHAFWPFDGAAIFTCDTDPAFVFWGDDAPPSPLGLTDIRRNDDGSVTFTVFDDLDDGKRAPAVTGVTWTTFQDACILQWSSQDPAFTGNSVIRFGHSDATKLQEVEVPSYEAGTGKYAYVIEGLQPVNPYDVQLFCVKDDIPGPVTKVNFTTNSDKNSDSYPFIYLKKVERGPDGSFAPDTPIPLRVYNVPDADGVTWYFNGKKIDRGNDGYYHLTVSGELKAVVSYPSGSTDIITKKIVVK